MKIVYLTWGETPRSYGVFGSQVIGQFVETNRASAKDEFYFISGLPLVHSGLVREKFSYDTELRKVKEKLAEISFSVVPIFAPQNFVNSSKATFPFMHFFSDNLLARKLKKINPDVVHCRSYHAAYAAIKAKEKQNLSYKIVFDARGIWPEEVALKKGYSNSNDNYIFLKSIEKEILEKSNVTIAVSDTMKDRFRQLGAKEVKCIYLSANTEKLRNTRRILTEGNAVVFTYVGALSENTWHSTTELHKLYTKIREQLPKTKLLIATTSSHQNILNIFSNIPNEELELTSFKDVSELKNIYSRSDYGLMSYFNPKTSKDMELSNMVLAVKIVEYLAGGLPIIVNKTCGGAAYLVDKYQLGITYDPNSFSEITKEKMTKFINDNKSEDRSSIAKQLFDYETNAVKYRQVYESLV